MKKLEYITNIYKLCTNCPFNRCLNYNDECWWTKKCCLGFSIYARKVNGEFVDLSPNCELINISYSNIKFIPDIISIKEEKQIENQVPNSICSATTGHNEVIIPRGSINE